MGLRFSKLTKTMKPIEMIGLASGNPEFVARWDAGCREQQREQDRWVEKLRSEGVKAAHPDDGWVDRKENTVNLCYPQFNDGLQVGDVMALGWPDSHRLVKITERIQSRFFDDLVHWRFVSWPNDGDETRTANHPRC